MFTIVEQNSQKVSDLDWFVEKVNARSFFETVRDVLVARAPGRLDVMGGIADYSGSLMLELPIAEGTFAAIQRNGSDMIEIASLKDDDDRTFAFSMKLDDLVRDGEPLDLASARDFFAKQDGGAWASYIGGVFFVLSKELGVRFDAGAKVLVASRVPIGKGVSSSAALEVSVMQAVCSAYGIKIEPRDLALLCQKVENHIVGAACGVMDQISTHCGEEGKLTKILCQPAEIQGTLEIPDEVEFWGIDSGVRHAVSGSDYSSVRVGAFMGYRIIAELAALAVREIGHGVVEIEDKHWRGYLSNVCPDEYEVEFQDQMPYSMTGGSFLAKYRGTTDTVTSIDPSKTYAIKAPTEHAIYENWRVKRFAELLVGTIDERRLIELGELMFASHAGYTACGLTETRTDRIVELVREMRDKGLFGARITGGGSGGTVVVLASRGNRHAIDELIARLTDETRHRSYIFEGSSPGCSLFGSIILRANRETLKVAE
ncbi:MAG TPA: hypothetical protein VJV05_02740 [Pyrinomonadaceae bacterium]|nr:hypothetical protein [Pyrinomonadaceae bacterium]